MPLVIYSKERVGCKGNLACHLGCATSKSHIPSITITLFPALALTAPRGVTSLFVSLAVIMADQ